MHQHGNSVSDSLFIQANEIMDKTFTNDLGYRRCKLYSRDMKLLDENVEIKFQYSQSYTINKDQVEYLAQFRPGYHPERKFIDDDGIERLGFYLEIPNRNTGLKEMWLILGKNDKNSFLRYNMLKCNWTFKWIKDGVIYSCLGVIRNRNNYNSGIWSDGFFTSVDNQSQFIVPTNSQTQTIDYNDRFMLSDSSVRPLVYEVSKLEDVFPLGTTKVTLKQDHYNPSTDNVELKICNYYQSPILPESPDKLETFSLSFSGKDPTLRIGGSKRIITANIPNEFMESNISWTYSFDNENLIELSNYFIIEEDNYSVAISAIKNFNSLGKIIKITATLECGATSSIELEVIR